MPKFGARPEKPPICRRDAIFGTPHAEEAGRTYPADRTERAQPERPVDELRDVARNIANLALPGPGDLVCIPADLLLRLRAALGEAT